MTGKDDSAVLFVDMLGFAALLEQTPDAAAWLQPVFQPMTSMQSIVGGIAAHGQGALVARFTGFHIALEKRIRLFIPKGITAITFSDSAFVHIPSVAQTVWFAAGLMRDLLNSRVPVRMGMAAGSFVALRFMSDNTNSAHVHSTQFLGTGVVRAYNASEKSNIKGLRILLHPSMRTLLMNDKAGVQYVRLAESSPEAYAEVNYLFMQSTKPEISGQTAVEKRYEQLKGRVDEMRTSAPLDKKHYYDNTIKALRRMHADLRSK